VSEETYNRAKSNIEAEPVTGLKLKGIGDVTVYNVLAIKE
jgi:hypothetical protein